MGKVAGAQVNRAVRGDSEPQQLFNVFGYLTDLLRGCPPPFLPWAVSPVGFICPLGAFLARPGTGWCPCPPAALAAIVGRLGVDTAVFLTAFLHSPQLP